jgi:hypothetical protein
VSSPTSVSKYAGVVATAVWTLGWGLGACQAVQHVESALNPAALLNLFLTFACSALGCIMTFRIVRGLGLPEPRREEKPEPAESGLKRLGGWLALFVWCAAAVVWNLAIFGTLVRAVADGHTIVVLLMIPFSVIGWFLLNLLFVSIGVILDGFFVRDETVKRWP